MMRVRILVALLLCCLVASTTTAQSKEKGEMYRVIFSTFDTGSAGSYAYLRNGIQSMLVGRLAARDRIVVLDYTLNDKELSLLKQRAKGKNALVEPVEADYLLTGALFSLTTGLNVQLTLYPFSQEKEVLRFSFLIKNLELLIPEVDRLSQEIAHKAFDYQISENKVGMTGKTGQTGFVTVHPEVEYKRGLYAGTIVSVGGSVETVARGVKRSKEISGEISMMAVGDLDGDGKEEIVVLSGRKLKLYNLKTRSITLVTEMSLPSSMVVHAINIADTNNDGKMELFVSGTDRLRVSSMIISWSRKNGMKTVLRKIPWYIRPVFLPEDGWVLAGQQRGNDKIDLIRSGIYHLELTADSAIKKVKRLAIPESINLFDFIYADINGDDSLEIVVIDQHEKMRIYNQANELTWVSNRNYGGSKVYIGPSQGSATDQQSKTGFSVDEDADRELIFIPGRMVAADLNGDGKQEIIINEHEMSVMNVFYKLRLYKGGIVVGLAWNGSALKEVWRTGKYRGYVAGYSFSLLEKYKSGSGEGQVDDSVKTGRLYIGSIPNSGTLSSFLPGMTESLLSVYDLDFSARKSE